jgi:EAL domain-containing protein (putative c-di-GMP-specific phosphodiesterase class I)
MEALLRWRSEELGDVSPGEFIPVAEKANLIQRISEWVFEESCRQLQEWRRRGLELVPLAVNFSSRQLHTTTVANLVTRIMRNFEVDPSLIEIEMTESAFVGDADEVLEVLSSLKATGVRIALDDFGTGYSSISHLARFPIDVLKIDQSFVCKIGEDDRASTLVSALIGLARRLSLIVVAEGVETEAQARFLTDEGCHVLQGYVLARPLEVEAVTELLVSQQA